MGRSERLGGDKIREQVVSYESSWLLRFQHTSSANSQSFFSPQFFGHATQHARSQFPNQGLNLYPLQKKKKNTESKTTGPPGKFLKTHRLWEHTYQFFTQHWSQGPWIQVYMISMRKSIMEINENSYLRLDPRIGLNLVKRHSIKMPKGPLGDLWILFLDLGAFRAFLCLRWAGAGQLFWN